jgi:hypothetical protein
MLRERRVLHEQDSHIDGLFSNLDSDARGDDVTPTLPHIGPAIGWPFIDARGVLHNERKPHRGSFQCPICPHGPFRASILLRHVQTTHCSETMWKCLDCGRSFSRKDKLHVHVRMMHGKIPGDMSHSRQELDPPAPCLVCQVPLSSWAAFRTCIMKHSKDVSSAD